jgi:hypothetical protein
LLNRDVTRELHRGRQNLITDEMKANAGWRIRIEIERVHDFNDVSAEFVPRVSQREDAFSRTLAQ